VGQRVGLVAQRLRVPETAALTQAQQLRARLVGQPARQLRDQFIDCPSFPANLCGGHPGAVTGPFSATHQHVVPSRPPELTALPAPISGLDDFLVIQTPPAARKMSYPVVQTGPHPERVGVGLRPDWPQKNF